MAILKVANIHFDVAGTTVIRANGANTLTFNTSGNEDVRIDDRGNVLIGRINSTVGNNVKLDVSGSINASAVLVNGAPLQTTTLTSNVVISVADNSNAALRITQTGTGDAIRVEDSANPDATPFIVDTTGNVLIGRTNSTVGLGVKLDVDGAINASAIYVNGAAAAGAATYSANVGNNSSNTFNVSHSLNKQFVIPAVRENSSGYHVYPDIRYTSANTIVLEFVNAPTTNQYTVIVLG